MTTIQTPTTQTKIYGKEKFLVNNQTADKTTEKERAEVEQFILDWRKQFPK